MGLFNGNEILNREVSDHIIAMEQEKSPDACRMFTSKVIGATKLALRLGEMSLSTNRKIMTMLLVILMAQVAGTEVGDRTLLTLILRFLFQ